MSSVKYSSVTLRIASKTMKAREITDVMEEMPSESHDVGEILSAKSAQLTLRSESLWLLLFDVPEERPLEEHIDALLSFAEKRQSQLSRLSSVCDIEVYCSYSTFNGQGGFVFDHVLAKRMALTGMDFIFDLFLLGNDSS